MNNAQFIGNLGKDAQEIEYTGGSGGTMTKFSIGVKGRRKSDPTLWVDCAIFGKLAEAITQYLTKGTKVYVSGEVSVRAWSKDGEARSSMSLNVQNIELLGSSAQADRESRPEPRQAPAQAQGNDDDIPF